MATVKLSPKRGGFLRPFGCGMFVRDFLSGSGPHGSPSIDPATGSTQSDIFRYYKEAIRFITSIEKALADEEKAAKRENRRIEPENIEALLNEYITKLPYKAQGCRYHSFVIYFSMLQKLGWVEPTGQEEPSEFQDNYPQGQLRKYFRLTADGIEAPDSAWSNPHKALYG